MVILDNSFFTLGPGRPYVGYRKKDPFMKNELIQKILDAKARRGACSPKCCLVVKGL